MLIEPPIVVDSVVLTMTSHRLGHFGGFEGEMEALGNFGGRRSANPSDFPGRLGPDLFLIPLHFPLIRFQSLSRFHHGLRRPNTHDCRAEGGSVFSPCGQCGGICWTKLTIVAFDVQAPIPPRARVRSSPTSTPVSPSSRPSRALWVRTVVTSCLLTAMASRLLQTMELP